MIEVSTPAPKDDPLMIAWEAHKATESFTNAKHWALTIQPMLQVGDPDAERKRYSLMPIQQREQHVDGSMWSCFVAGWNAAMHSPSRVP
jgi:hypothetical protein